MNEMRKAFEEWMNKQQEGYWLVEDELWNAFQAGARYGHEDTLKNE